MLIKIGLRLGAALLGVSLGILSSGLSAKYFSRDVSLCDLVRNPEVYDGRLIHVRAIASEIENGFLLHDCRCDEIVRVVLEQEEDESITALHSELSDSASEYIRPEAEVMVNGRFEASGASSCLEPRLAIVATRLKQTGPVQWVHLRVY